MSSATAENSAILGGKS